MRKKPIIICALIIIVVSITSFSISASGVTGGSIGEPIEFGSLGELLQYIENEQWENEWWYAPSQNYTKIDYLKLMDKELFLPVGYTKEDISRIKIDDVMVMIYLTDGKHLDYWFTEYVQFEKPTKICAPTEFRLLPGGTGVYDTPEVYNIFETNEESIDVITPTEGKFDREDIEEIVT